MSTRPPLPVRDGVGPTRLRIPAGGPWSTIAEFMTARFEHLDPAELLRRIDAGEIVGADGRAIDRHSTPAEHEFVWYHRQLPDEQVLPHREEILFSDADLVVVDKPHFLPTTPSGRYLRETALVRLRVRLDNPHITPVHRLDRPTAGLVMFTARPEARGVYQSLFEQRRVDKTYEAVSALPPGWDPVARTLDGHTVPLVRRDHLHSPGGPQRTVTRPGLAPNAETTLDVLGHGTSAAGRPVLHTLLRPRTGRLHQLRVQLAALGIPILGDRRYPELLPEAPDDPALPLQLLARELEFTDPISGLVRRFRSERTLSEAPVDRAD
ncbi:pseudouridine synthase [Dietzia aerolata]|uniref:RNA pseudouridylate synthase n=1 Tax=Dietzia aerolata TaxID=595984 RepID=A0ABV5JQD0_9ACTN